MVDSNVPEVVPRGPVICHAVSTRKMLGMVGSSLLVIVAMSVVAWDGDVADWEISILGWINGWPDWLEPPIWAVQQVGVLFAPVVGGLVIVAFTRRWAHLVPFVLVLPLKLGIEKGLVKQLVERERPFTSVGPEIEVRGTAFEGLSFPSGHTTTAFALGVLLTAFLPPRWRPIPIIWAAAVGIARLYFGEHNVADIIAGAAMGTSFAVFLWWAFLNRFVHPDCRCA
ncbi:MAG: membrane-associated phospholipid phosphatase [Candidatus Aldehydirespiratoraceae bacterium]|jgi:membrane-associated phospholipid phosphatase